MYNQPHDTNDQIVNKYLVNTNTDDNIKSVNDNDDNKQPETPKNISTASELTIQLNSLERSVKKIQKQFDDYKNIITNLVMKLEIRNN